MTSNLVVAGSSPAGGTSGRVFAAHQGQPSFIHRKWPPSGPVVRQPRRELDLETCSGPGSLTPARAQDGRRRCARQAGPVGRGRRFAYPLVRGASNLGRKGALRSRGPRYFRARVSTSSSKLCSRAVFLCMKMCTVRGSRIRPVVTVTCANRLSRSTSGICVGGSVRRSGSVSPRDVTMSLVPGGSGAANVGAVYAGGPVESAVSLEIEELGAHQRPGLAAGASAMARILDNPKAVSSQPPAALAGQVRLA
jgi:hypothetical protein